jgi:predicted amidohydrolase
VDFNKKRGRIMARFVGVSSISFSTGTGEDTEKMQRAMGLWENYIDTASLDKPDIIILPEIFLQNSASSSSKEEKNEKADLLPEGGAITEFISHKSKEHRTYIFASYWRRDEKDRGRYNSAVLFDREGKSGWSLCLFTRKCSVLHLSYGWEYLIVNYA